MVPDHSWSTTSRLAHLVIYAESMKLFIWLGMFVGSVVGGYIPVMFGSEFLSFASVLWSGIGAVVGILIGYKVAKALGME